MVISTATVVNANGNTVAYKNGKLVVTDQYEPTVPDVPEVPEVPKTPETQGNILPKTGATNHFVYQLVGLFSLAAGIWFSKGRKVFEF